MPEITNKGFHGLKALVWKQPFASLMLSPFDKDETRTWNTNYRGHVLICAGLALYTTEEMLNICGAMQFNRIKTCSVDNDIYSVRGMAIGIGKLVDCRPMVPADENKCYVQYREPWTYVKKIKGGREVTITKRLHVHKYEDVRAIDPTPWRGTQGLVNVCYNDMSSLVADNSALFTITNNMFNFK